MYNVHIILPPLPLYFFHAFSIKPCMIYENRSYEDINYLKAFFPNFASLFYWISSSNFATKKINIVLYILVTKFLYPYSVILEDIVSNSFINIIA